MLFLGRIYARRALEPVQALVKQVKSLDEATLANRVDEGNGKDEVAQLAHSFNDLLVRLESSFRNQRQFIANASHELRTPLTAISGQMEVLLMRERDLNQYRETVASVLDDLRALSVMTNRLLILAQTGSAGIIRDFEVLRIDEAVWSARTELLKLHPTYKVHVNMAETDEPDAYNIFGNDQLIRTVLLNLMDNACKYSADHRVTVSLATDGKMVAMRVVDDGIGIPAEDLKTITEPFFRGSNTTNVRGHGLGLSMVKRIVELHDGSFDIQSVVNQGTKVTVIMPVHTA
jgi:signal transduction histidine kinase